MIISIHQPDYIPYIGYFYKIAYSDFFVFLDNAQFSTDNMHHWNNIKTPQGELRLKVPVENKLGMKINEVRTRDTLKWKEKHLKTIEMNYKRAPFFEQIFSTFSQLLLKEYSSLAEMNININSWIANSFKLNTPLLLSSNMGITTTKETRVIDICKVLNGNTYLSGNGARAYQVPEHFADNGLTLTYTNYKAFEYPQLWKDFIPNLSILDYIFNCGFDWTLIETHLGGKLDGNR